MRKKGSRLGRALNAKVMMLVCLLQLMLASIASATETVTYYHNDALGSPVAATGEGGVLLWRESYEPFGARQLNQNQDENHQWYTGKMHDEDVQLAYYGARWYDPELGRFLSIDPAGVNPGQIHSFNRYAYANNNPYKFVDPDGEFPQVVEAGIIVAAIFVAAAIVEARPDAAGYPAQGGGYDPYFGGGEASSPWTTTLPISQSSPSWMASESEEVPKGADKLNPKLIQENPRNLIPTQTKSEMSGSQVKRLTKDMKQNGFDQGKPVDAWRNPNTGRLEIQDGHHRTEAARKAGLDKIPVQVWE